ncbi:hypothetical protein KCH_38120 [Kitasatospora cheerisanensis KCTC 2395]|uniref:Uncharacterized protein n=1 Tax=Kitasatospora cheerisanensis KCTC 2395 TaxID=1348663 RepID=A0A066Z100_9ACTN|nr:hypothetical protein KCH_38120 [Kitasatospora cheerisanensis KCTC 2395]
MDRREADVDVAAGPVGADGTGAVRRAERVVPVPRTGPGSRTAVRGRAGGAQARHSLLRAAGFH